MRDRSHHGTQRVTAHTPAATASAIDRAERATLGLLDAGRFPGSEHPPRRGLRDEPREDLGLAVVLQEDDRNPGRRLPDRGYDVRGEQVVDEDDVGG